MKGDMGWFSLAVMISGLSIITLTDHRLMSDIPAAWDYGVCNIMGLVKVPFKYVAITAMTFGGIYWVTVFNDKDDNEEETSDER